MRRTWPLLMVALVTLFLAEGQRSLFASLLGLASDALSPALQPAELAMAMLPLLVVLAAPFLPLARWLDRGVAVAAAALATALFRLLMTSSALGAQLVGGTLVVAAGAIFLTWAVGHVDRRAMAAGVVAGLAADQLLRLAGSSYDLSLQPVWLPAQLFLTLGLITVVVLWAREGSAAGSAGGADQGALERREGGLRMRGGLALGALLFLDLHVLGLPPVVAHWAGVSYAAAGLAVGVASALAVAAVLQLGRPTAGRTVTIALVALVTAGAVAGQWAAGPLVAGVMVAAHLAALLLVSRALDPASGRRSGATVAAGFGLFTLATALYSAAFFNALPGVVLDGWTPWIFLATGLLLAACFILLPRPAPLPSPGSRGAGAALALSVALAAVVLSLDAGANADGAPEGALEGSGPARVATWNVRHGYDEDRRFDPGAAADSIRGLGAGMVMLQDAPVGAPTALGLHLPLWLGRRTGLTPRVPPIASGRTGEAILVRPDVGHAPHDNPRDSGLPIRPPRGGRDLAHPDSSDTFNRRQ